ncbi:MAG TPA: efflux RND transporter periplasmic adaptor subunit [Blastocatellia bacterium]|nr:efflux RND transporter periplasmic adaptor subunit [Blastocatellia bacterium]
MKRIVQMTALSALIAVTLSCGKKQEPAVANPTLMRDVKIEKVAPGTIDDLYEASGTVRSKTSSAVSARILGSIIAIPVHEGDRVRAGQTLVEIDSRDATTQLQNANAGMREASAALDEIERNINAAQSAKAAAEANQALAASTFNRYKALFERRSVSPQEFDEIQAKHRVADAEAERANRMLSSLGARKNQVLAKIDQAKADVAGAKVSASYSRVTSPISGIITAKHVEIGTMASPGTLLITVEDDSHYRLEADVEESRIGRIQPNDQVQVRIDALGQGEISGRVSEIVPTSDPASRSHTVKIDLPAQPALRSGSYGKAIFAVGQKQAITIPQRAISERGQLVSVFVVDESGTARLRLIKTGKSYGDRVEVLAGLADGERIVVDRIDAISDGSRVE